MCAWGGSDMRGVRREGGELSKLREAGFILEFR